jgi:hypothetical protein
METLMSVRSSLSSRKVSRIAKAGFIAALLASVSFGAAQAGQKVGWVWADQASSASYTPNTNYSFNSTGGSIGITRSAVGTYQVNFAGLGAGSQASNVLVSGYDTSGTCKVSSWGGGNAGVLCFDAAGAPVDSRYTLIYQSRSGNFGSASRGLAFLWANQPETASYTPDSFYQYNSTGGTNTMTRIGTGSYEAVLPGLTSLGGAVQATAYGAGAGRCKTTGWGPDVDGQHVSIQCYDASGAASDQYFTLVFAANVPVAYLGTDVRGVYGWFQKSKGQNYKLSKIYRFNDLSSGALIGNRSSKGQTVVSYPGSPSFTSSNMVVTAYGSDNSYCNVNGWTPLFTTCYGQGGHVKDSRYDVAFQVTTTP